MVRRTVGASLISVAVLMASVVATPAAAQQPLLCNGHEPTIIGTDGDDILTGTQQADVIMGLDGNDTIEGLNGNDVICGNNGDDTIDGGNGVDWIGGGRGQDVLDGGNGNDTVVGGDDDDMVDGGRGDDTVNGSRGDDNVDGGPGVDICQAAETVDGCEEVRTGELVETVVDDDLVDTTPAGSDDTLSTGSFRLAGSVPPSATSVVVTVDGETIEGVLADGRWAAELVPPQSGTYVFEVVAADGDGNQLERVVLVIEVVAHDDDDTLYTPEFVTGRRLGLTPVSYEPISGRLVFDGAGLADMLAPGTVLTGDPSPVAPEGFLRVVETVQEADGQTIVTGRTGNLLDVFRQLKLSYTDNGGGESDIVDAALTDSTTSGPIGRFGASASWGTVPQLRSLTTQEAAAADPDAESTERIFDRIPARARELGFELETENASFDVDVGVEVRPDIDIDIDWCNGWVCLEGPELRYFKFEVGATAYAEANLTSSGVATLPAQPRELGSRRIAVIGAPPVQFAVTLEATGTAEVEFEGGVEAWVQVRSEYTGGYEYRSDGTGRDVYDEGPTQDVGWGVSAFGRVTASAQIDFATKFKLYDVVGPEIITSPGLELIAEGGFEITDETSGRAFIGIGANAFITVDLGFDTEILGIGEDLIPIDSVELFRITFPIFSKEKEWFVDRCDPDPSVILAGIAVIPALPAVCDIVDSVTEKIRGRLGETDNPYTDDFTGQLGPGTRTPLGQPLIESAADSCVDVAEAAIDAGVAGTVESLCVEGAVFYSGHSTQSAVTNHIAKALVDRPEWAQLRFSSPAGSRNAWYYTDPNTNCNRDADGRVPSGLNCDEYPFFSSNKGYAFRPPTPSTEMISARSNSSHGSSLGQFYRQCPGVGTGQTPYLVVPTDPEVFTIRSVWTCQGRTDRASLRSGEIDVTMTDPLGPVGTTYTAIVAVSNGSAYNTDPTIREYVAVPAGVKEPHNISGATCEIENFELFCTLEVPDGLAGNAEVDFTIDFVICDPSLDEEDEPVDPDCSNGSGRLGSLDFGHTPDTQPGILYRSRIGGDPHLTTLDGLSYGFQAAGEFWLITDNEDVQVQARFEPVGDSLIATLTTAMAVKTGESWVTVERDGTLWIDGEQVLDLPGRLGPVDIDQDAVTGAVTFTWPDGTSLQLALLRALGVAFETERSGVWEGLWGNADGDPTNDLIGINGPIGLADDFDSLYNQVRPRWLLTADDTGFSYREGESTATYYRPEIPDEDQLRFLSFTAEERNAARTSCVEAGVWFDPFLEDCIYDFLVSGDPAFIDDAAAGHRILYPVTEVTVDQTKVTVRGQIETEQSRDLLVLDATPGQLLSFDPREIRGVYDCGFGVANMSITAYDESLERLGQPRNVVSGCRPVGPIEVPESGTVIVSIASGGAFSQGTPTTGSWTLDIGQIDNELTLLGVPFGESITVEGIFDVALDGADYTITGDPGDLISVNILSLGEVSSVNCQSEMQLGIGFVTEAGYGGYFAERNCRPWGPWPIPDSGSVTIRLSANNLYEGKTGSYRAAFGRFAYEAVPLDVPFGSTTLVDGQVDVGLDGVDYVITGDPGDLISVDVESLNDQSGEIACRRVFDLTIEVFDGDTERAGLRPGANGCRPYGPFELPESGVLRFRARGDHFLDNSTGSYSLRFGRFGYPTEPVDVAFNASVEIAGSLDIPMSGTNYAVTGDPGDLVSLTVTSLGGNSSYGFGCRTALDLRLEISADGASPIEVWPGNSGCLPYGPWEIPASGVLNILARGGPAFDTHTGDYTFSIGRFDYENVEVNVPVNGSIAVDGTVGVPLDGTDYVVTGSPGETVTVDVTALGGQTISCRGALNLRLEIFADGPAIDNEWPGNSGCGSYGPWELPASGQLTVRARGDSSFLFANITGTYSLTFNRNG